MSAGSFALLGRWLLPLLLCCAAGLALSAPAGEEEDDDPLNPRWKEQQTALPDYPRDENLLEFYVGPVTSNRFFIDTKSLAVGGDGVVRYTLVIRTSGGATNVSHEGIRCDTAEYKVYGLGREDKTWVKPRSGDWKPIENKPINRHHAALKMDYFCPQGAIRTPAEGIAALKRGLTSSGGSVPRF